MAIIKACLIGNSLKNTGKECDTSMVATAMLIAVPPTLSISSENLLDPLGWITPLLHASKQNRVYPFFGIKAPINTINNNAEADVKVTLDDGTEVFLRYGIYNRTYETIAGGVCYARALQGLNKSGYNIIEIDQQGQMLLSKNPDGTHRGLATTFMYAPSPIIADFKTTPYKNRFQYSFSPVEFVQNGEIFTGAGSLLSLMGLIDSSITDATGSTTTILKINVVTDCANADLVAQFGAALGTFANNFVVTDKLTGEVIAISAANIVSGHIELTGVFTSGRTYHVVGALPSVWLGNAVSGYDGSVTGVDIAIP